MSLSPSRPVLAALAVAGGLALAGCGGVNAPLSREQATVNFRPDTTTATVAAAGQACGAGPGLAPAGAPVVPGPAGSPSSLRYDISHASAADLARLQRCLLLHFAGSVLGVSIRDTATQG